MQCLDGDKLNTRNMKKEKKQKVENQINGLDNDKKNDDNSLIDNVDDINQ